MLTICITPKDYDFILAYESLMTHYAATKQPEQPVPATSRRSPWAHRITYACWTIERLEHVELVAARYGIR